MKSRNAKPLHSLQQQRERGVSSSSCLAAHGNEQALPHTNSQGRDSERGGSALGCERLVPFGAYVAKCITKPEADE
jgi:hypothetical protein